MQAPQICDPSSCVLTDPGALHLMKKSRQTQVNSECPLSVLGCRKSIALNSASVAGWFTRSRQNALRGQRTTGR